MDDYQSFAFDEDAIPHHQARREAPRLIILATEGGCRVVQAHAGSDQPHVLSINDATEIVAEALERGAEIRVITGGGA